MALLHGDKKTLKGVITRPPKEVVVIQDIPQKPINNIRLLKFWIATQTHGLLAMTGIVSMQQGRNQSEALV